MRRPVWQAAAAALFPLTASALAPGCALGLTTCIQSQGTTLPSADVILLLDECERFTANDIGQRALQLSSKQVIEIAERSGRSPAVKAWFAYESLHDSALTFDRSIPIDRRYPGVKNACRILLRDFNDDSKWSK